MSTPESTAETITGDGKIPGHGARSHDDIPSQDVAGYLAMADLALRLARERTASLDTADAIDKSRDWLASAQTSEGVSEDGE